MLNGAYGGIGNTFVNQWQPGTRVGPDNFTAFSGLVEVSAWLAEPGVIVFDSRLSKQALQICADLIRLWLLKNLLDNLPDPGKPPVLVPVPVGP